jgi:hypothetical protein
MNDAELGFCIALLACIIGGSWSVKEKKGNDFMTKQLYKDAFVWGFILWLIGYTLGIMLFTVVPLSVVGWIIMPIGTIITIWVLVKKVKVDSFQYYALLAVIWTLIAVVFDYFFLVKVFKPEDGYYKLDVYLYYTLTFVLPLIVGWRKKRTKENFNEDKVK